MRARPLIGIVAGLGPLAGEDVLDQALAYAAEAYHAVEDVEYPDIVLFSHGIESFDAKGTIDRGFVDELRGVVREVDLHHPTVLGIACNTAHLCFAELQACTGATIVNLIDEVAQTASRSEHEYLLLSSSTTRSTGLYHHALHRRGVRFTDVSQADQLDVDEIVHTVMAHNLAVAAELIDELVLRLENRCFDAIIAGCTELPLALRGADVARAVPIIDSNEVLARALVDRYFAFHGVGTQVIGAA